MSDIVADLRAHAADYARKATAIAEKRDLLPPLDQLATQEKDVARQIGDLQAKLDDLNQALERVRRDAVDRAALDYQHRSYVEIERELLAKADGHAKAVAQLTRPRPAAAAIAETWHAIGRAPDAEPLPAPHRTPDAGGLLPMPPGIPAPQPPGDRPVAGDPLDTHHDLPAGRSSFRGPDQRAVAAAPGQTGPRTDSGDPDVTEEP
jgi:hypothetical protein